jgi:hypothetical protein
VVHCANEIPDSRTQHDDQSTVLPFVSGSLGNDNGYLVAVAALVAAANRCRYVVERSTMFDCELLVHRHKFFL